MTKSLLSKILGRSVMSFEARPSFFRDNSVRSGNAEIGPQSSTPAPLRLVFIDGVRAIASFWVLLCHCMMWGGWYGIPLPNAKVAVDIFMLVSGYLMFHLAEERSAVEPPESAVTGFNFWIRRFFRIAPVYYVVLVMVFLLSGPMRHGIEVLQHANLKYWARTQYYPIPLDYSFSSFVMHVSFLFGLSPDYASSVGLPDWSIGLEMQFYVLFPLLWMAFRWLRPIGATLAILLVWSAFKSLSAFFRIIRNRRFCR